MKKVCELCGHFPDDHVKCKCRCHGNFKVKMFTTRK